MIFKSLAGVARRGYLIQDKFTRITTMSFFPILDAGKTLRSKMQKLGETVQAGSAAALKKIHFSMMLVVASGIDSSKSYFIK